MKSKSQIRVVFCAQNSHGQISIAKTFVFTISIFSDPTHAALRVMPLETIVLISLTLDTNVCFGEIC